MKVKELIETLQELNQPNAKVYIVCNFIDDTSDTIGSVTSPVKGVAFRPARNPDTVEIVC